MMYIDWITVHLEAVACMSFSKLATNLIQRQLGSERVIQSPPIEVGDPRSNSDDIIPFARRSC
jgi:hypothetical protein